MMHADMSCGRVPMTHLMFVRLNFIKILIKWKIKIIYYEIMNIKPGNRSCFLNEEKYDKYAVRTLLKRFDVPLEGNESKFRLSR